MEIFHCLFAQKTMAPKFKGYAYEDKFIQVYFEGKYETVKPIEQRIRFIRMLKDDLVWYEYPCPAFDCKVKGSSEKCLQEHCDRKHATPEHKQRIKSKRKLTYPVCTMCATVFHTQQNYEYHLQHDKIHSRHCNIIQSKVTYCPTCFIQTKTQKNEVEHEMGKKHLKKLSRLEWIKDNYTIEETTAKSARK